MSNIAKVCEMWAKTIANGGSDSSKRYANCNVYYVGDTIYSYGSHFPMAVILSPNLVWLNGVRFSNSTANHQSHLRAAIATKAPDATVLTVPKQALDGAGLLYETLRPVDIEPERFDYTLRVEDKPPADMQPIGEHEYVTYGGIAGRLAATATRSAA